MNEPIVSIYDSPKMQIAYLIVSTINQDGQKTYVFTIDKNTGGIYHSGIAGVDVFPIQKLALEHLNITEENVENIGKNLIGATIFNDKLVIICVKEHKKIATLFGQDIFIISEVSYTFFELNPKSVFSPPTKTHLFYKSYDEMIKSNKYNISSDSFLKFDLRLTHFFSLTLDINSKFPYSQDKIKTGMFTWNKRFLIPFENNSCLNACIIVLQGGVYNFKKENASITYIIKRSSMYPGTRYNSRGLKITSSKKVETANECECDLIFSDGERYYAQTWRRGSPPIFWRTDTHLFSASHVLSDKANTKTPAYFYQQIIKRFRPSRVHVVSLLKDVEGDEQKFNRSYQYGLNKVIFLSPNNEQVKFVFTKFDINTLAKELKENHESIAEKMFKNIMNSIECSSFTEVDIENKSFDADSHSIESPSNSKEIDYIPSVDENDNDDVIRKPKVKEMKFNLIPQNCPNRQSVVFRFNCADSLDRTNIGTFYYGILLTAKFVSQKNITPFMNESSQKISSQSGLLWKKPLSYLSEDVINFLKIAFVDGGNVISNLYTGTNAIKSRFIENASDGTIECTTTNTALDDMLKSGFRRLINTLFDDHKQKSIEEWTQTYNTKCPRFILDHQYISLCSQEMPFSQCGESILELTEKDIVLPKNGTLDVMFPEPLFLYQVSLLILKRNIEENLTVSLQVGNNRLQKAVFFNDMLIPILNDIDSNKKGYANDSYVWVTYNLRKIAKYSNILPIDPESLRPATFVSLYFSCPNKINDEKSANFRIGNIKFVVKKPSPASINQMKSLSIMNPHDASEELLKVATTESYANHRYMITGKPKEVNNKTLRELIEETYKESFHSLSQDYFTLSRTVNKSLDLRILPDLDSLTLAMMKWIEYGISNYNHFREFIKNSANPWIFDLSSRMLAQLNYKQCPICGKKTNPDSIINSIKKEKEKEKEKEKDKVKDKDKENENSAAVYRELLKKSTVYMPNPVFPSFYIKTINLDSISRKENVTFLCQECSDKYNELLGKYSLKKQVNHSKDEESFLSDNEYSKGEDEDENDLGEDDDIADDDLSMESNIISRYNENFVKVSDVSDIMQTVIPLSSTENISDIYSLESPMSLCKYARIYDFPLSSSSDSLNVALHHSFMADVPANWCVNLAGSSVLFSVCFALYVEPTEVSFGFSKQPEQDFVLEVTSPGIEGNLAKPKADANFTYEVSVPSHRPIQSLVFHIKPAEGSKEIALSLSSINILGHMKDSKDTSQDAYERISYNEEISLPNFARTKDEKWNYTLRTQTFSGPNVPKTVSGLAVSFSPKNYAVIPKYFIVAFYNEKQLVHMIPIIMPSEISNTGYIKRDENNKMPNPHQIDNLYFPISDQIYNKFEFDTISVFYIEKSAGLNPLSLMFF